ncbi:unnamed protein product [Linum trigynum]|uniref:Uncharacterized protein n=1 Tax=Linum trigynum TaxID=586398 RepID=A0AAV2DHM8_9ROSI
MRNKKYFTSRNLCTAQPFAAAAGLQCSSSGTPRRATITLQSGCVGGCVIMMEHQSTVFNLGSLMDSIVAGLNKLKHVELSGGPTWKPEINHPKGECPRTEEYLGSIAAGRRCCGNCVAVENKVRFLLCTLTTHGTSLADTGNFPDNDDDDFDFFDDMVD